MVFILNYGFAWPPVFFSLKSLLLKVFCSIVCMSCDVMRHGVYTRHHILSQWPCDVLQGRMICTVYAFQKKLDVGCVMRCDFPCYCDVLKKNTGLLILEAIKMLSTKNPHLYFTIQDWTRVAMQGYINNQDYRKPTMLPGDLPGNVGKEGESKLSTWSLIGRKAGVK